MSETFLQMSPDQGGHRFGPFAAGAVYFGTDRNKCQIMLDVTSGLAPCHAVLTISPSGHYTVAPTARNHALYVVKAGSNQGNIAVNPTPMNVGDTLYLGSLQGANFTIEASRGVSSPPPGAQPGRRPGQPGYAAAFGQEVQRQVETKMLTKMPLFRLLNEYWYKYKTGVLSQPRNVIGLVVVIVGFLGTGCVGCLGSLFAALSQILS
jgi:hypothetical protein